MAKHFEESGRMEKGSVSRSRVGRLSYVQDCVLAKF